MGRRPNDAVDDLIAWLREQIAVQPTWVHLSECQMTKAAPPGWPFDGFSCNCGISAEMSQWFLDAEAKTRIIRTAELALGKVNEPGDIYTAHGAFSAALLCALQFVALAYEHRSGYQEDWRPEAGILEAADSE